MYERTYPKPLFVGPRLILVVANDIDLVVCPLVDSVEEGIYYIVYIREHYFMISATRNKE